MVDVEETVNVVNVDGSTGTDDNNATWAGSFSMVMFDDEYANVRDTSIPVNVGSIAHVSVEWSVDSLVGKAKFMLDQCSIVQEGVEMELDIIRRNCYLTVVSAMNHNEGQQVMVDRNSRFQYRSFAFTDSFHDTNITLKCKVL